MINSKEGKWRHPHHRKRLDNKEMRMEPTGNSIPEDSNSEPSNVEKLLNIIRNVPGKDLHNGIPPRHRP